MQIGIIIPSPQPLSTLNLNLKPFQDAKNPSHSSETIQADPNSKKPASPNDDQPTSLSSSTHKHPSSLFTTPITPRSPSNVLDRAGSDGESLFSPTNTQWPENNNTSSKPSIPSPVNLRGSTPSHEQLLEPYMGQQHSTTLSPRYDQQLGTSYESSMEPSFSIPTELIPPLEYGSGSPLLSPSGAHCVQSHPNALGSECHADSRTSKPRKHGARGASSTNPSRDGKPYGGRRARANRPNRGINGGILKHKQSQDFSISGNAGEEAYSSLSPFTLQMHHGYSSTLRSNSGETGHDSGSQSKDEPSLSSPLLQTSESFNESS